MCIINTHLHIPLALVLKIGSKMLCIISHLLADSYTKNTAPIQFL
jgi:hypothetical protein